MVLLDVDEWPLVVIHWPQGPLSDEQLDEALRQLSAFYGRRHALLHDALAISAMTPAQRRRLTRHSTEHEDEIRRSVVASAAVIRSALWRGIIVLIQRVAPTPSPFRIFATSDDARQWLLQALRRAGLWRPTTPLEPPPPSR
jgi:hypothetical protein